MKFSIKDFFSKCEKSLMENFIFCPVKTVCVYETNDVFLDCINFDQGFTSRLMSISLSVKSKQLYCFVTLMTSFAGGILC